MKQEHEAAKATQTKRL